MPWAPPYMGLSEMRSHLRISDQDDDDDILDAVEAASRAIDRCCHRQFGRVDAAEQRFYEAAFDKRSRRWYLVIDDVMTTDGFAAEVQDSSGATVGAISSYLLTPRNAVAKGMPWTEMLIRSDATYHPSASDPDVAITAQWGWTAIPGTVKKACKIQASRFFNRKDSPYGVAGSPEAGAELRLLAKVDPDVELMLRQYTRLDWVVAS